MSGLTVYGTGWCPDCRQIRKLFGEHRVPYTWIDVETDRIGLAFIYSLDVDLAEATRVRGCFTVRVRSTGARTYGSFGAVRQVGLTGKISRIALAGAASK